ncbi:MAG: flagellar assembly protein FliW [Oligoflexia bacterium]|nr:flagellar assembly protein FliW [Oligoflexia bacterium]
MRPMNDITKITSKTKRLFTIDEKLIRANFNVVEESKINSILNEISQMTFETTRFGEIIPKNALYFEEGVYGFEGYKEWELVTNASEAIVWLQSLKDGSIAFPMVKADLVDSKAQDNEYYILTIPPNVKEMTANKRAPIVIDQNQGSQKLKNDSSVVNFPIYQELRSLYFK